MQTTAFLTASDWWLTLAVAAAAASLPALRQSFRLSVLAPAFALWAIAAWFMATNHGMAAAITGASIALFWGILMLLLAVFLTGLGELAKKRYGKH